MSDRKKLSDLLHEQINCLEMVADVLQQEQSALLQRDACRLEDICRLKLERPRRASRATRAPTASISMPGSAACGSADV